MFYKNKFISKSKFDLCDLNFPKLISFSVHYIINIIRNWSGYVDFFISVKLYRCFNLSHKNRLKNVFQKYIFDSKIWTEVEKMYLAGNINFSDFSVYRGKYNFQFSLLSVFLLEIYLSELDFFVLKLSRDYNLKRNIFSNKKNISFHFSKYLKNFMPLKLEKSLIFSFNIRQVITNSYYYIRSSVKQGKNFFAFFSRHISYVRYIDNFLIGLNCSIGFTTFFKKRIINFVRSNLQFDLGKLSFFSSTETFIFFLGFNLKLSNFNKLNYFNLAKIKTNTKYLNKFLARINLYSIKIYKLSLVRLNNELVNLTNAAFKQKSINFSSSNRKFFWAYVFQLECVRSTQYDKLLFTTEAVNLISSEIFNSFSMKKVLETNKYFFNLYLSKINIILKDIIDSFPLTLNNSVLPVDLALNLSFLEFRKKVFLFSNFLNARFDKKINFIARNPFLFSKKNGRKKVKSFLAFNVNNNKNFLFIEIFLSSKFSLAKMSCLGLINPSIKCVIAISNLLIYEDFYIIRFFGQLAKTFLIWFSCCKDFSRVKNLVNLIRESCYLTLSRKHNKTKRWAYRVYTLDLIITLNLFKYKSFFPTKKFLLKVKRHFFFFRYDVFFDEIFFLT